MRENAALVVQDSDASLAAKHTRLIKSLARKYSNGSNTEDLVQEGMIALLEARRTWREEAQFWTYARTLVLGSMVRYATNESSAPSRRGSDTQLSEIIHDDRTAEDELELAECVSVLSTEMISLSAIERQIVRAHITEGKSLAAAARELDLSNDKVERIYHGALTKLRDRVKVKL